MYELTAIKGELILWSGVLRSKNGNFINAKYNKPNDTQGRISRLVISNFADSEIERFGVTPETLFSRSPSFSTH